MKHVQTSAMRLTVIVLACGWLVGCGDADATVPTATAPSKAPSPSATDSGPDGAGTPQELVDRMAILTKTNRVSHLLPMVLPSHRGAATYLFGYLLPSTMISTQEMMGGFASKLDPDAAKEFQAELTTTKTAWRALLAKHKVHVAKDHNPMAEMMALRRDDATAESLLAKFTAVVEGVDHAAFIEDAIAFSDTIGKKTKKSGGFTFNGVGARISVDGDRAIVTQADGRKPTKLTRQDGRWYIDMEAMLRGG